MLAHVGLLWLLASGAPHYTLAGLTLGARLGDVSAQHPDAERYPRSTGNLWSWKRSEGGTVDVYVDASGIITSIRFTANEGQRGSIDLPCAGNFPIEDSHVNFEFANDPKACVPGNFGVYELPDRSILTLSFDGPGDGQLHEAVWDRAPSPL